METVFVLMGRPFLCEKHYLLGVYRDIREAENDELEYSEYNYSDLAIEEVEIR